MTKKTIGGFISALRKANGMTQKELAEILNVSDKTVSRWERDEGSPDISLIPVIAEVFGITCDELLRGERRPVSERGALSDDTEPTLKGEKQLKRLLSLNLSKYKARSLISAGISILGLAAAMTANFGFLRAYIGFFAGTVFYLAGIILQAVFVNSAFSSVLADGLSCPDIEDFKRSAIALSQYSFGLTFVLFCFSLPLVIFPFDTYMGLTAKTWFTYGIRYAAVGLIIYCVICWFLNAYFLNRGVYTFSENKERKYRHNHKLKRNCGIILILSLLVTFIVHSLSTELWGPYSVMEGTVFEDYESFIEFIEQDISYEPDTHIGQDQEAVLSDPENVIYYDKDGNEITKEEALRRTITDSKGSVVCEYLHLNESVCSISYTLKDGTVLPITVRTYDDLEEAKADIAVKDAVFAVVYFAKAALVLVFYILKRTK